MTHPAFPKAVIFDWDDTLVDTWRAIHVAINETRTAFGQQPWSEEDARQQIGPPARVLFSRLFGEERWPEADKVYIAAYQRAIAGHIQVYEGVREMLAHLAGHGVHLVVVSAKRGELLRQEARQLGLDHFFSRMVGAGDAARDKPAREAVEAALAGSGIAADSDVWMIGDSLTDIATARNAGIRIALIETKLPSSDSLAAAPPDVRISDHAQLAAWLKGDAGMARCQGTPPPEPPQP